jgi:hypothetical protein
LLVAKEERENGERSARKKRARARAVIQDGSFFVCSFLFFFSLDLDLDFFYFFVFHSEKPSAIAAKRIDLEENACKERRRRGKDRRQEGEESPPPLSSFSYS